MMVLMLLLWLHSGRLWATLQEALPSLGLLG